MIYTILFEVILNLIKIIQNYSVKLFSLMNIQPIIRSGQNTENWQSKEDQSAPISSNYEIKYKKALKDIAGIIKANHFLKEELNKLKNYKGNQMHNYLRIQKQEIQRAFENAIREKNSLMIANENKNFEISELKHNIQALEQYIQKLKTEYMGVVREKQTLERVYMNKQETEQKNQKSKQTNSKHDKGGITKQQYKEKLAELRQKQALTNKTLENYAIHNYSLNQNKRKLQEENQQLQNRLISLERNYRVQLDNKDLQVLGLRSEARKQFITDINKLKKQNNDLKATVHQLSMKIQNFQYEKNVYEQTQSKLDQYDSQLLKTLKQLQSQMQPMKNQIVELQQSKESEKQQLMRNKTTLKMKVIELQNQIELFRENSKKNAQKLIETSQKIKEIEEKDRVIKKLEQENRMLGGRVVVLQSKDVALRVRTGQQLEEKVIQFQTRVEMLLNEKENFANIKNVSIHQLIALKAYIVELDAKIKALMNENQYSQRKYKNYKQKYQTLLKESKSQQSIINSYKSKTMGYQKIISKLQIQFEKSLANESGMSSSSVTVNPNQINTNIEIYKRRFIALKEKLDLQEKYSKQQLQALRLNYQTKLIQLNSQLDELKNMKQTIQLYKNKNQDLVQKLSICQNQLFQLKVNSMQVAKTNNVESRDSNQTAINSLYAKLSEKDKQIYKLRSQANNSTDELRIKIRHLQQENSFLKNQLEMNQSSGSSTQRYQGQVKQLQRQIQKLKNTLFEMQSKARLQIKSSKLNQQTRFRQLNNNLSEMSFELQTTKNKLQQAQLIRQRYERDLSIHKQMIAKLEKNLEERQEQYKQKLKEIIQNMEKEQANNINNQKTISQSQFQYRLQEEQRKLNRKNIQVASLRQEISSNEQRLEQQNIKIRQIIGKCQQMRYKAEFLNDDNQRLQGTITKLQFKKKQLEKQLEQRQTQILTLQNEQFTISLQVSNLKMYEEKNKEFQEQIIEKEKKISQLSREINRLNHELHLVFEKDTKIIQLESELNRIKLNNNYENEGLSQQAQAYNLEINRLKNTITDLTHKISYQDEQIYSLQNRIATQNQENLRLTNALQNMDEQLMKAQNKLHRANLQLGLKGEHHIQINNTVEQLESQLIKLRKQNRELLSYRDQLEQLKSIIQERQRTITKQNSDIKMMKFQMETFDFQNKDRSILKLTEDVNRIKMDLQGQIQRLEELVFKKDQTIQHLKYELNFKNQEGGDTNVVQDDQLWKLKQEINTLESEKSSLENQLAEKNRIINQKNYELVQLRSEKEQFQFNYEQIQSNYSKIKQQIVQYRTKQENSWLVSSQKQQTVNKLNFQIKILRQSLQNYELQLQQKSSVSTRLNQELAQLRNELNSQYDELSTKDITITNLNYEINNWKSKYEFIENQKQIKQNNYNQLLKDYQNSQIRISQLQLESDSKVSVINRYKIQISSLKTENQQYENTITIKNSQITKLNQEIFRINLETDQQNTEEMFKLKQELSNYKFRVASCESDNEKKEEYINRLIQQIKRQNNTKIQFGTTYSEQQMAVIKEANQKLRHQNLTMESKISDMENYISKLLDQLKQTSNTMQFGATYSEQQMNMIKESNQRLKHLNLTMESKISDMENYISKLLDQLKQTSSTMQFGSSYSESQLTIVKESNQKLKHQNLTMESKISDMENYISKLLDQLKQMSNTMQSGSIYLEQQMNMIKEANQKLRDQNLTMESKIFDMENYISKLLDQLKQTNSTMHFGSSYQESQLTIVKQSNQKLRQQNAFYKEKITNLQFQLQHVTREYQFVNSTAIQERKTCQEQILFYQSQIEKILAQKRTSGNYDATAEVQKLNQMKYGFKMYQEQINRLTSIVQQLQAEVEQLRLKMTYMMDQQNRIEQNLTTMVLTFAQVQALRYKMQQKQEEIIEIRQKFLNAIKRQKELQNDENQILSKLKNQLESDIQESQRKIIQQTKQIQALKQAYQSQIIHSEQNLSQESVIQSRPLPTYHSHYQQRSVITQSIAQRPQVYYRTINIPPPPIRNVSPPQSMHIHQSRSASLTNQRRSFDYIQGPMPVNVMNPNIQRIPSSPTNQIIIQGQPRMISQANQFRY